MVKGLRDSIHYLHDDPKVSCIQLLVATWQAETEANDMKFVVAEAGALRGSHSSEIKVLTKQISNIMSTMQSRDGK